MLINDSKASSSGHQTRSRDGVLWLLLLGLLLALAGNAHQFLKTQRMAHDMAQMQQTMQSQFAELRELQSGALEQNVRRFDELNKRFDGLTATTRAEVRRLLGDE